MSSGDNDMGGIDLGNVGDAGGMVDILKQVMIRLAVVGLFVIAVMFIMYTVKKMYFFVRYWYYSRRWLYNGTKNARKKIVVPQDPNRDDAITLFRSNNEKGGIEYTYMFWIFVDDWTYQAGEWKHVLHKGNPSSMPLRAPGIWLHPNTNAMRVYTNTFKEVYEYADVENLPHNKWFHVAVCVQQRNLDIFVNGNLATRKVLTGLPRQNAGDVYINAFKGFSGYMSNIRYYPWYTTFDELEEMLLRGPSLVPITDHGDTPPYFSNMWWANRS